MSRVASAGWTPPASAQRPWPVVAFIVLGSLVTVAATIIGNGSLAVAMAPVILIVLLAAAWVAPLRLPLLGVIALSLGLDSTNEGPWSSPLGPLGQLLSNNVNKSIPINVLVLPGVAFILLLLLLIHAHRGLAHIRTDNRERAPSADVLPLALCVSLASVLWVVVYGIRTGGDAQMAKIQVQAFVMTLVVAYLAAASFRGERDYRTLGTIVIGSACIKSAMAFYVSKTVQVVIDGKLNYAITHGESLLFAAAAVLLVVRIFEIPTRRNVIAAAALLPVLLIGMAANQRRLVYVEIAFGLALYWVVGRRSPAKRLAARIAIACLPVFVLYVGAGWNSPSKIFAPVKIFRSVGDSDTNSSTLYRDLENYNLLATVRYNPVLGPGLGHPFAEPVKLPDISFFREYKYMPHNSLLGLWAFCGPIGFTGIMLSLVVGIYLSSIAYRAASNPVDRIAAFMSLAMILIFLIHCWGDIGFSERKAIYLVGPGLGMAAQLAVTTGAWTLRRRRT